jgi:hypothetical protein
LLEGLRKPRAKQLQVRKKVKIGRERASLRRFSPFLLVGIRKEAKPSQWLRIELESIGKALGYLPSSCPSLIRPVKP